VRIEINQKDKLWLKENYPDLKIVNANPCLIKGRLCFDMFYDKNNKVYFLNPVEDFEPASYRIRDEYEIEILFKKTQFSNLPAVREAGRRIKRTQQIKGFAHSKELHVNENGNACLCPKQAESRILTNGFNLQDFLCLMVTPFFYGQSFYAKNGFWAFGDYGHCEIGLLQYYLEVRRELDEKLIKDTIEALKIYTSWSLSCHEFLKNGEMGWAKPCLCGAKKLFQECHPIAYWSLWLLKQDVKKINLNLQ
jgi:hypothetical protein